MEVSKKEQLNEKLQIHFRATESFLNAVVQGAHELAAGITEIRNLAKELIDEQEDTGDGNGEVGDNLCALDPDSTGD